MSEPKIRVFMGDIEVVIPRNLLLRNLINDWPNNPNTTGGYKMETIPNVWSNGDGVMITLKRIPREENHCGWLNPTAKCTGINKCVCDCLMCVT